jgi:integrase
MGRLTALSIKNAKPGRHGDGDGLYLLVKPSGAKSWLLRVQKGGKRQDIGLGSVDMTARDARQRATDELPLLLRRHLSLSEARDKASELRRFARAGRDPIVERDRERRDVPTFKEAGEAAHKALKGGWAAKNAAAFLSSLEEHAYPQLGELRVDAIDATEVRNMLEPIWLRIPVMARKVRQRTNTVLDFAKSKGWRVAEAPRQSVTIGLPNQPEGGNFSAMPYADVPKFVAQVLSKPQTNGRLALLLLIFTAARPGEVRSARWKHIDLAAREWNRPADLMKGRKAKAHMVTLNDAAIELLKRLKDGREVDPEALIFPGATANKPMSDMTMNKVLTDAKASCDAHGFRSSFRDWAAEKMPEVPDAVAEAALAHVVPDKVVRAYKRTKFVELRRTLLDAWSAYLLPPDSLGQVAQ